MEHGASSDVQECVDADASDGAHDAREEPSVVDDDVVATLVVAVVAAEVPAGDLCGKIEIRLEPMNISNFVANPHLSPNIRSFFLFNQ